MRIAILSDIHGNPSALEAVLQDIQHRGGADAYWVLGDLCAVGYDPAGVLDRLSRLNNGVFIRGNADRYVVTGERPTPTMDEVRENIELLPLFTEVTSSFTWTQGYLAGRGWFNWLANLPLEHRQTLPDGTRVLLVHAEPGADDGNGLHPGLTDEELWNRVRGSAADLICVGHFHRAMDRKVENVQVINPGPVSNPLAGDDLRPSYALLLCASTSHHITFHKVNHDYSADLLRVEQCGIPGADYIKRLLTGNVHAQWMRSWDGISHTPTFESKS
jgi:putative phosphoesterase